MTPILSVKYDSSSPQKLLPPSKFQPKQLSLNSRQALLAIKSHEFILTNPSDAETDDGRPNQKSAKRLFKLPVVQLKKSASTV